MRVAILWSGGKDSALALDRILRMGGYQVMALVTNFSKSSGRVTMHGVRKQLIQHQARSLQIPLWEVILPDPTMDAFEAATLSAWHHLRKEVGIEAIVYGDIFLEDIRSYRDRLAQRAGLQSIYPLWNVPTDELLREFWRRGHRTVICAANASNARLVGRPLDHRTRAMLAHGTDPCGEHGEFHTFCFDGPHFHYPIPYRLGSPHLEIYSHNGIAMRFYYVDLLCDSPHSKP